MTLHRGWPCVHAEDHVQQDQVAVLRRCRGVIENKHWTTNLVPGL